jgi:hypothetical protein
MKQDFHIYRQPVNSGDVDEITRRAIHIVTADIEIDWMFCSLGPLFAPDPPPIYGQWHRHAGIPH